MSTSPDDPTPYSVLRDDTDTFAGRLPDPTELIRYGGRPGVRYLMVDASNLHEATQPDEIGERWTQCRDVPPRQVQGPAGSTTIMILSKGQPIPGSDPINGVREWSYDRTILKITGLSDPYPDHEGMVVPKPAEVPNAQQDSQASKNHARGGSQPAVR